MNSTLKKILWPLVMVRRCHEAYLKKHNPEKLFSIWHKRTTGIYLDLDNPQTLGDKIAYMAFRTDTSEWTRLADKVRVREYVEECGFGNYLPELYGVWEHAADIDFEHLPDAFVIKTNNASATNILVRDKAKADIEEIRKQLEKWLKIEYGYDTCQPHYSKIKPLILAEEFLGLNNPDGKMLNDYKFYCVNGTPKFVQILSDRKENTHDVSVCLMDMEWNSHPEFCSAIHRQSTNAVKPACFKKMIEMAKTLAAPFPFVRIDLYEIESRPILGEMTFTPGFDTVNNMFERLIGGMIKFDEKNLKQDKVSIFM